ncbi:MAG TPA: LysM peptidoglycan-binding domain-containing protein [Thermoanaerobaculia bacterium]|nr:LysM peptidoglycan-binding domain-containing protein [Thermoanaerobaculia bacterium]
MIATSAFAQRQTSQPPRELHRVGDHWTAYNPPDPATYPAGAKTHTIVKGDTLWALAQQYYGNAYLWPQLWESNTWITDAHWIYPGDVLLVEGEGNATAAATTPGDTGDTMAEGDNAFTAAQSEDGLAIARVTPAGNPVALATEADIYCYGYIGHPDEPMPNFVESHEDYEVKYLLGPNGPDVPGTAAHGDFIFVHGDASTGLVAGETYLAVEPQELITHPATGEVIGRQYDYIGQIRILCTENGRSRAMVTESCREINIGARLKPIPQLPIPIARIPEMPAWCDAPTGRTTGYIVESRSWELGLVEGNLVQVDLGSADQIEPGDFLTVFRPSPVANQPRVVLGEIGILTTEANTATGIIVASRREMLVGDQVEAR